MKVGHFARIEKLYACVYGVRLAYCPSSYSVGLAKTAGGQTDVVGRRGSLTWHIFFETCGSTGWLYV